MKLGFTGTRSGMTWRQREQIHLILGNEEFEEYHHGDCLGADEQFQDVCMDLGLFQHIVIHPPENDSARAYCEAMYYREPLSYLERNKQIVAESDVLVACPGTTKEIQRSGTWATVRSARRKGIPVVIIWPDGSVIQEADHVQS